MYIFFILFIFKLNIKCTIRELLKQSGFNYKYVIVLCLRRKVCVCVFDLIKVGDDVIEEAETLHVLMDGHFVLVKVGEARQRSKEDADPLIRLSVQLLHTHTHTYS